jgi:hypothetical protein
VISEEINGSLETRRYFDFSKEEAIELFEEELGVADDQ